MPKAVEPSVRVLSYFQDVPLSEAQQSLAAARHIVSRRAAEAEAAGSLASVKPAKKATRKPRRAKKDAEAANTASAVPARRQPTSLRPSAGQSDD